MSALSTRVEPIKDIDNVTPFERDNYLNLRSNRMFLQSCKAIYETIIRIQDGYGFEDGVP